MVLLENQEKSTKTLIKKYFITVYWWRIFINNVWWKQLWKLKKNYVSIFGVSPTIMEIQSADHGTSAHAITDHDKSADDITPW
jgi:hypothetical protein